MNTKSLKLEEIFSYLPQNNLSVVDLFSGCSGLSLGFLMAGYQIKAMVDFDDDSLLTAKKNRLAEYYLNLDLFEKNWFEDFERYLDLGEKYRYCDRRTSLPGIFINRS